MKAIMYHYVREYNSDMPNFRFLDVENFRKQLLYFREEYGFVTKDEWVDFVRIGKMPEKEGKVILTFDDAMSCHYDYVFPELMKQKLWGIFYVPTSPYFERNILDVHRIHLLCGAFDGEDLLTLAMDLISDEMIPDIKKEEFRDRTYTTQKNYAGVSDFKRLLNYFISYKYRSQVLDKIESELFCNFDFKDFYVSLNSLLEMKNNGMVIGSHSVSHPVMSKLNYQDQSQELQESFAALDGLIDQRAITYCHPYGGRHSFDNNTIEILNKLDVAYSFMVDPREIIAEDFVLSKQSLPRFDCNKFEHGAAS